MRSIEVPYEEVPLRRIVLAALLSALLLVPAGSAAASCPALSGTAKLDFGRTLTGKSKLDYDGAAIKVPFVETGFVATGPNTADVFFDWFFPGGTVSIVEHSTTTPLAGPLVAFSSTIDVLSGGSGSWTWSGVANTTAGVAHFTLAGDLCIGP